MVCLYNTCRYTCNNPYIRNIVQYISIQVEGNSGTDRQITSYEIFSSNTAVIRQNRINITGIWVGQNVNSNSPFSGFSWIICHKTYFSLKFNNGFINANRAFFCKLTIQNICWNLSLVNTSEKNGILLVNLVDQYSWRFATGMVSIFKITSMKARNSFRLTSLHVFYIDLFDNCFLRSFEFA